MDAAVTNESLGHILVVDDDPAVIRMVRGMLTPEYDVRFTMSGEDCLRMAHKYPPDVILLDLEMPGLNGYEVCRRLKSNPATANIAVIIVTSYFQTEQEVTALDLGAADFLIKPVSPAQLRARVRTQFRIKELTDRMRDAALIDGLTGVANRRAFDERLDLEWRRARRNQSSMSLLMVDVDHFKSYNNRYGHLAGDDALRSLAKSLEGVVRRPPDLVARCGGEAFAVLLPETPYLSSLELAERMRAAVATLDIEHLDSPLSPRVTISIGVCGVSPAPGAQAGAAMGAADSQHLVRFAGDALYAAKGAGRNRVEGRQIFVPGRAERADSSA